MRQQNGQADFTLLPRHATSPIFNGLEGFQGHATVWQGGRANLRGRGGRDGLAIPGPDRRGAEGNTDGRTALGLAHERCRKAPAFGLAETLATPPSGVHRNVPTACWGRGVSRRCGCGVVLADEGERGGLPVVRSGNRNAAGTAGQVSAGLRIASEGAAFDSRLPADAEAARAREDPGAWRSGGGKSGDHGTEDFGQRPADAVGT